MLPLAIGLVILAFSVVITHLIEEMGKAESRYREIMKEVNGDGSC